MDSLINAAARALASGDPLGALQRIALRDDAPALALRGIAMAQLGDYARARQLLRRAARRFGTQEARAQARCHVAEAEVALADRDLAWPVHRLAGAAQALAAQGDHVNARHARLIVARRHLLLGELAAAAEALAAVRRTDSVMPPPLLARAELTRAELALRQVRVADAAIALEHARTAAQAAGIPALLAEVERVRRLLLAPAARLIRAGEVRILQLEGVEAVYVSGELIVDGCRRAVRGRRHQVSLARRPVLFELVRVLAEAWPHDVARDELIRRTFAARVADASYRSRLRVEVARLRAALKPLARIESTARGFMLAPRSAAVAVLAPPIDGPAGSVVALLEDGGPWSTSALARALGSSQRTVQRTLRQLEEASTVRAVGRGRSRRWLAPTLSGFTPTLLLPGSLALR